MFILKHNQDPFPELFSNKIYIKPIYYAYLIIILGINRITLKYIFSNFEQISYSY